MKALLIDGGEPLRGTVSISGAKNAALPACVAALLTEDPVVLHAVPQLRDVSTILYMLGALGKRVVRNDAHVSIAAGGALVSEANAYSVGQMRASFLVLGPLVARLGKAVVPLPGGCAIGARPVDLHLEGLRALGAQVEERIGSVLVTAKQLTGTSIHLPFPSVGATEQIIMTASLAAGETSIHNASIEPEVIDLIDLLEKMGAVISVSNRTIDIVGQRSLHGAEHTLIPDRMEAGTMLLAGAITQGSVSVSPMPAVHLEAFLDALRATGCEVEVDGTTITGRSLGRARATSIATAPYPGFPTDLHPPMAAYLATANGRSSIQESVFEQRFAYTRALSKMGTRMIQDGSSLMIEGVPTLSGRSVEAPDIRGGAALILAGLAAQGRTTITGLDHVDRGHEHLEAKLRSLGARIERRESIA
ncbi:UDP-N-acetylglucosamine 1-carboxyvinyltransferase [Candidatus Bipolaricaulota bacterium]|nr:UDP-N-acetylglucosamine 1-carboxyvinyltransferase [Candidatus Bipolaricaulota bacterium]